MTTVDNTFVLVILITFLIQILPIQTIACFTCIDCGDPFNAQLSSVSTSLPSCVYCYKLTVYMAYAPSRYVVKECVQTCNATSHYFGGASLQVNCCSSSSYCNKALGMYAFTNLFFLISMLFFIFSIRNSLH